MFNLCNRSVTLWGSFWVFIGMTCFAQAQVASVKFGDATPFRASNNMLPMEPPPTVDFTSPLSTPEWHSSISGIGSCRQCDQSGCYGKCFHLYAQPVGDSACQSQCIRPQLFQGAWQKDQKYFQYRVTPPCPGNSVNQFVELQKSNGRLQQYVFYNFHFETGGGGNHPESLTKSGIIKVSEIARIWPLTPGPIYLTPSGNLELDRQRHQMAFQALVNQGLPLSPEYIVVAPRQGPGLIGIEAIQIFNQQLQGSLLNPVMGGQGANSVFSVGSGNGSGSRPANR